jgi:membrane peptidoglycan carboxypeptidase
VVWVGAIAVGLGLLFALYLWFTLPDITDPRNFLASQSTVMVDRNGVELYRFFQEEDRTYVEGNLLPQDLKDAIVAIEDERFYERGCLDVRALARVVFRFGQAGGASTLTRQLARNALDLQKENIISRKLKELILGCQMESRFDKDELITLYLNWIPFGQNAYGAAQASQRYFGIPVQDLSLAQSAVLAGLPQRPSYFNPYGSHRYSTVSTEVMADILEGKITTASQIPNGEVRIGLLGGNIGTGSTVVYVGGRTDQVLRNMQDQEYITEQERLAALDELETLVFASAREDIRAPHFVLWVRDQLGTLIPGAEEGLLERGGMQIETTLDWEIQQAAEATVEKHRQDVLDRFGGHNIALMALEPKTREVLAYVGNADFNDEDHGGKIDMVQVPRQPGSSFKPFVYAKAFENGYGPATVLFDVKTRFGDDEPQNFDGGFWGPLTIRQALGASRNIPAAKAFFLAGGEDNILRLVASMGAPAPLERRRELAEARGEFDYGWPLALGAAETPLFEMTNAYATFANGGVFKPVVAIRSIKDKNGNILYEAEEDTGGTKALDERIAYQITSILSDESVRPSEFWKTRLTVPGYQTAAKTGTSNKCLEWAENGGGCLLRKPDNAWVLGYTPNIVTGVWAGNADSSAMFEKADGLNTSSAIWQDFMYAAHRTLEAPVTTFTPPEGLVQPQVSMLSGQLPTECTPVHLRRADVFLRERAPTELDPACVTLMVDKLTGLLASDTCPEDAREEKSFFNAHSILPDRWPEWETGVQAWMAEQMELWNASETHTGSVLPLPQAPTEECDPSLTPGRLVKPELEIVSPTEGGIAAYPAFSPVIKWTAGAAVREVRYELDGRRVAIETEPPYQATIRVPRSVDLDGVHTLDVTLEDEYFNKAVASVEFRFGEDTGSPVVHILEPKKRSFAIGEDIRIRAEAEDDSGAVKYVQFYLDDTLLTTKPTSPYTFDYTLDLPAGTYRLRAVAEDVAEHTGEDEITIGVGGAAVPDEPEPEEDAPVANDKEPSILTPTSNVTLAIGASVSMSFQVPFVGEDIRELQVLVRNDESGEEDVLLRLTSGEGVYRRTWASRRAGQFTLVLRTTDRSGSEVEWGTRSIVVE